MRPAASSASAWPRPSARARRVLAVMPPPPTARSPRRHDAPVAQLHDAIAARGQLGAMGDEQHRATLGQARDRGLDRAAADAGSRCAVGSSSTTSGASSRKARASAMRRDWPADRRRPPSPTRVRPPSGSAATSSSAPAARSARATSFADAPGRASRTLSSMLPANERAALRHPRDPRARHARGSTWRRSTPPHVTVPSCGSARRATIRASVVLPAPLGPIERRGLPGREHRG